jgi:hypothetical protein
MAFAISEGDVGVGVGGVIVGGGDVCVTCGVGGIVEGGADGGSCTTHLAGELTIVSGNESFPTTIV